MPRPRWAPGGRLFSCPGNGGTSSELAWLGTALAAMGFVAAAVDHPGNNASEDYTLDGMSLWWLRTVDLGAVIDAMLAGRTFGGLIDPARIGAVGHSLGGYTVIAMAGGITDPGLLEVCCRSPAADASCHPPPPASELRQKIQARQASDPDFRQRYGKAGDSWRDPRVRAVFAMAPGPGQAFTPQSLGNISIPVAIVSGGADEIIPPAAAAQYLAKAIPRATVELFPRAGHFVFIDICTLVGRVFLRLACGDPAGIDRDAVHGETIRRAVDFFTVTLR